jgi:hypothetical protein
MVWLDCAREKLAEKNKISPIFLYLEMNFIIYPFKPITPERLEKQNKDMETQINLIKLTITDSTPRGSLMLQQAGLRTHK